MSYEYKATIQDSIIHYYDHVLLYREYTDDVLDELDHVYAQADEYKEYRADTEKLYNALKAKGEKEILKYKAIADEYEAKAKAFDDSLEAFEELRSFYEESRKTSERSQIRAMIYKEVYSNVLREMKLILEESGESE